METLSTTKASMLNELSPYALKRTCKLSEGEGIVSVYVPHAMSAEFAKSRNVFQVAPSRYSTARCSVPVGLQLSRVKS